MSNPIEALQSLKLRPFLAGLRAESVVFWLLCFYILLEYLRPQAMYPFLDILPWGQVAILACVTGVFITQNKAIGFGAMDAMFIAFSLLVIISGVFAWNPAESLEEWTTYASWVLMYFCIVSILTTPNRIFLFALFFVLINFKLSQHGARVFAMRGFSFASYGLSGSPGWFHNSGELALQMVVMFAMSLSILLAFREYVKKKIRWWVLMLLFPGTAALTVIGSSSRGGQLALVAVLLIILLKGGQLFKKVLFISIVFYLGLHILPEEQIARFNTMGDDGTSELRLMHWEHAMDTLDHNPLGIGYRNWPAYYEAIYNPEKVEQIHNTVLEVFVDLGYPGGILFLIMLLTAFAMNAKTKREMHAVEGVEGTSIAAIATGINLGLIGTIIAAFFMSVLFYPMFWVAFALTSALRHISRSKVTLHKKTPSTIRNKAALNEQGEQSCG